MQRLTRFMEQSSFRKVLIVLDGLEVVQEGLDSPGGFGLLRDSSLRHFMRRLAQGGLGFRVIVTSRFPFPELVAFQGAGYRLVETDSLDPLSARSLLKSRGVKGNNTDLDGLIRDYGNYALTLDHLGTLLRDFFDGDPRRASELPPLGTTVGDAYAEYQAYRLSRIFSFYELHLPPNELTVLKVLCVFRVPVPLDSVVKIFAGDREETTKPKAVPEMNEVTIRSLLAQLRSRRLISFYGNRERTTCSVHPAIRDHFYRSIGPDSTEIHAAVSTHLVALAERPEREKYPLDSAGLDVLEEFIYHTVKSGEYRRALEFYDGALGGYTHLSWRLADYQRGLRITSLLADAEKSKFEHMWWAYAYPTHDRSLFHLDMGRPALAESQMSVLLREYREIFKDSEIAKYSEGIPSIPPGKEWVYFLRGRKWQFYEAALLQCICDALISQGKLPEAERIADSVINHGDVQSWLEDQLKLATGSSPFGRRAVARYLSGKVSKALEDFREAEKDHERGRAWTHNREIVGEYHAAFHAVLLARLGRLRDADALLDRHASHNEHYLRPMLAAQFDLAYAETNLLSGDHAQARVQVDSALAWSIQSGHQEVYARASLLAARAAARGGDSGAAGSMLSEAEQVARACGFKVLLADILTVAGHLAAGGNQTARAAELAAEALEISSDPACGYKWGEGNASHLLAEVMLNEGDATAARAHVKAALKIRKELKDPRGKNTRLLAERIGR
jgi:tetratricopeptide (TPR) repeat protein